MGEFGVLYMQLGHWYTRPGNDHKKPCHAALAAGTQLSAHDELMP